MCRWPSGPNGFVWLGLDVSQVGWVICENGFDSDARRDAKEVRKMSDEENKKTNEDDCEDGGTMSIGR